jgi:DNA-binding Lrp family transcriptional regulator
MLQLSYGQLSKKLHLSKAQCRRAMDNLERLGTIKRHLPDIETDVGNKLNNVMFIELFSDRLLQLTFPGEDAPDEKNVTRVSNEMDEVITFVEPGGIRKDVTNTKNTTEITNKDYLPYQSEQERVRDQIDYEILIEERKTDKGIIDNFVDIMVEVNMSRKEALNVNGEPVDAGLVKARLGSLNAEMIRTILDRIKDSVVSVSNMKAYLITILFNTPATYETELAMQVSRDMYVNPKSVERII